MNPAIVQIGMLLLMGVVFYFLLIRPQQKQRKQLMSMRESLKVNDQVVTIGGLYGTVIGVNNDTVILKCSDRATLTFDKAAIRTVLDKK